MTVEDPREVARLREALGSLVSEDPSGHVDAGRIFDALHGNSSADERRAIVDQLLANPSAAEAWRLAREMPADSALDKSTSLSMTKWMSMAAAAVLAVALGWQVIPWRQVEEPPYRSVETRAIRSEMPAADILLRTQPVLRWTEVEGARYRVRVLTTDLHVLEESEESPAREHTLGEATLRRIPSGARILWQVEGRVPGEAVIVSPTFSIRVP